uniref:Uncharacterized protein n=1 Tax=Arundo donax TaxID=35708 RepID=A0A0A9G2R7_ARUDO
MGPPTLRRYTVSSACCCHMNMLSTAAAPTGVTKWFHSSSAGAGNSSTALTNAAEPVAGVRVMRKSPEPPAGTKNSLTTPTLGGEKDDSTVYASRTETVKRAEAMFTGDCEAGRGKKWRRSTRNAACAAESGMVSL